MTTVWQRAYSRLTPDKPAAAQLDVPRGSTDVIDGGSRSRGRARVGESAYRRLIWLGVGVVFVFLAYWNVWWLGHLLEWATPHGLATNDWSLLASLDPAHPYAGEAFRWSVPAAWIWAGVVAPLGFVAWTFLHFAALATIGNWRVVLIALITFPFWADVASGNVLTFAFVLAWHALSGRRWAVVGFAILAALVPRPLMLPVLAWLLWRSSSARVAFGVAAIVVVGSALLAGEMGTWLGRLAATPANELSAGWNVGPSSIIGAAWIPVGLVLGAYLTAKGRLGLASLAVSPYVIHYYAIFGLLELAPVRPLDHNGQPVSRVEKLLQRLGAGDVRMALDRRNGLAVRPDAEPLGSAPPRLGGKGVHIDPEGG